MMEDKKRLVALTPILFRCIQYQRGDTLPADNKTMVDAWINAGSARWEDEAQDAKTKKAKAKAVAATATPGRPGISTTGNQEDLAGRIPETPERQKPKPKRSAKK
nr:hypothetical protein [uncultured Dysosmobacter sp.]